MGPFCVLRSALYRENTGEGIQTCLLRCEAAYNQQLPWYQIRPILTRSDLCSGLYGIKRLTHEDLCSTSDASSNKLVDCSEICHGRSEEVVAEGREEDSGKPARKQLPITRLRWRQHHLLRSAVVTIAKVSLDPHTLSTEAIL